MENPNLSHPESILKHLRLNEHKILHENCKTIDFIYLSGLFHALISLKYHYISNILKNEYQGYLDVSKNMGLTLKHVFSSYRIAIWHIKP